MELDYRIWAGLSALFAGLTAVLSKKGLESVPSNMALAVRVSFILVITWLIAFATKQANLSALSTKQVGILALSAFATGASWLCYFRALQLGPVSSVAPIDKLSFVVAVVLGVVFLKERLSTNTLIGGALIIGGVIVTMIEKKQ